MKTSDTFLILFVLCGTASLSVNEGVELQWNQYKNECLARMNTEPRPKGVFCDRMFDNYTCWTDGKPNSTVKVPCPWYLPWYKQVHNGSVFRECGPDGQWVPENSNPSWRDHSQCNVDNGPQIKQMMILASFRVMYTVGYCISLASLTLAITILLLFRKLHCTRNYIHTNLFASFILRAISILTRDILLRHTADIRDNNDQMASGCRLAQVLMHYCVGANYYWLLVEGLYLHNLLVMTVFSESRYFCGYLLIGWGAPVLFVVPWIIVRYLFENARCWEINENMSHWWIIRTPILLAILVNFFIFIRIILILISKLRAHQMRYTDYKVRLAKSTLTLIPLLGIHGVVFEVLAEEHTEGLLRTINLFFQLLLNSFQGLLVAILYCFLNKEVQAEIKRKWQRWRLGMTDLEDQRNTGSNTPQAGASVLPSGQCHAPPSPCQPAARCPDGRCLPAPPYSPPPPPPPQLALPRSNAHRGDQLGARQLKTFCYIPAHGQDGGGGGGGSEEKSFESYC